MPRYRFTIRDGDGFDDEEGVVLPDDFAARTHAIGIIQELENASATDWAGHTMQVTRDGQVGVAPLLTDAVEKVFLHS
jgi:Domain of unknown function (DUF6894)